PLRGGRPRARGPHGGGPPPGRARGNGPLPGDPLGGGGARGNGPRAAPTGTAGRGARGLSPARVRRNRLPAAGRGVPAGCTATGGASPGPASTGPPCASL